MDLSNGSDSLKKICQSIEERDQTIFENNVKIKYYNNLTEKLTSEISVMKRRKEKIDEEIIFHKEQNRYFQLLQESLEEGSKIMEKCITNHQTFEIIMTKYSKINKLEEQAVKDDFNNMYLKIKEQLESNLLYQQLKEKKIAFLKADIEHRQEAVKVKVLKAIIAQKLKIQKQIFYNYFINLATNYIKIRKSSEQLHQNIQKDVAEENSIKMNYNVNVMEKTIESNYDMNLNQKISEILQKDSEDVTPPKVRIISEQIIVPAFKDYSETANSEYKLKKSAWLQKWKKRLISKKSMKNTSKLQDSFISQQSNQSFSQDPTEIKREINNEQIQHCVDKDGMKTSQELVQPFITQTILEKSNSDQKENINLNIMNKSQITDINDVGQQPPQIQAETLLPTVKPTSGKENRSVHFNLAAGKEAEFNFEPLLEDDKFSSFFPKPVEAADTTAFGTSSSNGLNLSLMDAHAVQDEFRNLQTNIQFSPEYEYDTCTEKNPNFFNFEPSSILQTFEKKQTDNVPKTGGRIFSFGSSYNPFQ